MIRYCEKITTVIRKSKNNQCEDKDKKDREIEDKRLSHTFEQVAYDLIEDKADTWTNSKSRRHGQTHYKDMHFL